jgi:putative nucleotidyltransferase with HDIG domain
MDDVKMNIPHDHTEELRHLIEQVNATSISSIGCVVTRIIAVINDPDATAKELVDIILTDPPLAANVLRLVNSAYCAPKNKIADIQQAVIFIGFEALKELALNQKVCEIFKRGVRINGYSREKLWKHSVAVALFCKMIYRKEFAQRGENAYALGLLHDLGIIIRDQFQNEMLLAALQAAAQNNLPLNDAERETSGYDHTHIGMALAENWRLPKEIVFGIGYHHDPRESQAGDTILSQVLHIANYCCQKNTIGYCDAPLEDAAAFTHCCQALKIEPHAIDLVMGEVHQKIADMEAEGLL